jgi:hypothetical protein
MILLMWEWDIRVLDMQQGNNRRIPEIRRDRRVINEKSFFMKVELSR